MTNINMLSRTIEQLRDASMLAKAALADQALAQALGLFKAYDVQLSAQRVTIDNLTDRIGRLEMQRAHTAEGFAGSLMGERANNG